MMEAGYGLVWFVNGERDPKAPYLRAPGAEQQWTGNRLAARLYATREEAERVRHKLWDPALFPTAHARVCWISRIRKTES